MLLSSDLLIYEVLPYLSCKDILRLSLTSRALYDAILASDSLWEFLILRDYPRNYPNIKHLENSCDILKKNVLFTRYKQIVLHNRDVLNKASLLTRLMKEQEEIAYNTITRGNDKASVVFVSSVLLFWLSQLTDRRIVLIRNTTPDVVDRILNTELEVVVFYDVEYQVFKLHMNHYEQLDETILPIHRFRQNDILGIPRDRISFMLTWSLSVEEAHRLLVDLFEDQVALPSICNTKITYVEGEVVLSPR